MTVSSSPFSDIVTRADFKNAIDICEERKDFEGVVALCNWAIERGDGLNNPHVRDPLWIWKARAHKTLAQWPQAFECFEKLTHYVPEALEFWIEAINAALMSALFERAYALCESARNIHPDCVYLLWRQGQLLQKQGRFKDALALFEKGHVLDPENIDVLMHIGMAALRLGDTKRAVDCLQKTIEAQPDYVEAWGNLGNALLKCGDIKEAGNAFEKMLTLNPHDIAARTSFGIALARQGDFKRAKENLEMCANARAGDLRALAYLFYVRAVLDGRVLSGTRYSMGRAIYTRPLDLLSKDDELLKALKMRCMQEETLAFEPYGAAVCGGHQSAFLAKDDVLMRFEETYLRPALDTFLHKMNAENTTPFPWPLPQSYRLDFFVSLFGAEGFERTHLPRGLLSGCVVLDGSPSKTLRIEAALKPPDCGGQGSSFVDPFTFFLKNGDLFLFPSFLFYRTISSSVHATLVLRFHVQPLTWRLY